jgi:hypothetical protein
VGGEFSRNNSMRENEIIIFVIMEEIIVILYKILLVEE